MNFGSFIEAVAANPVISLALTGTGAFAGVLATLAYGCAQTRQLKAIRKELEDNSTKLPDSAVKRTGNKTTIIHGDITNINVNVDLADKPDDDVLGFAAPGSAREPDPLDKLALAVEEFTEGESFPYDRIWKLHFELGAIGVPWPGPGVSTELRRAVSKEILAAFQDRDIDRARRAWGAAVAHLNRARAARTRSD